MLFALLCVCEIRRITEKQNGFSLLLLYFSWKNYLCLSGLFFKSLLSFQIFKNKFRKIFSLLFFIYFSYILYHFYITFLLHFFKHLLSKFCALFSSIICIVPSYTFCYQLLSFKKLRNIFSAIKNTHKNKSILQRMYP